MWKAVGVALSNLCLKGDFLFHPEWRLQRTSHYNYFYNCCHYYYSLKYVFLRGTILGHA